MKFPAGHVAVEDCPSFSRPTASLQSAIQVHQIMVRRAEFIAGTDAARARALLSKHSDLDIIPIVRGSEACSYIERASGKESPIERKHLISDSTLVIDLAEYFHRTFEVLFVLTGNSISGLVHVSDLNSILSKVSYFAAVHDLERACMDHLRVALSESLLDTLSEKRRQSFEERRSEFRKTGSLPYDAAVLYFVDAIKLATESLQIPLSGSDPYTNWTILETVRRMLAGSSTSNRET